MLFHHYVWAVYLNFRQVVHSITRAILSLRKVKVTLPDIKGAVSYVSVYTRHLYAVQNFTLL